jgi:hypothetical protein
MRGPWRDAFWLLAGCTVGALVLMERFEAVLPALAAWLAAWWMVGVGTESQDQD